MQECVASNIPLILALNQRPNLNQQSRSGGAKFGKGLLGSSKIKRVAIPDTGLFLLEVDAFDSGSSFLTSPIAESG